MRNFNRESNSRRDAQGSFKRDTRSSSTKSARRPARPDFKKREFGNSERRGSESRFDRRSSERSEGRFERRGSSGSDRGFNRGGFSSEKQMHSVICEKCGERCEVPFRPTGDKPVYCSRCFRKGDSFESSGKGGQESYKRELDEINRKLDKIIKALDLE